MVLSDISDFVSDKISSNDVELCDYVTTDSLLQNKKGRTNAEKLPPVPCKLTRYEAGDVLISNIRPYLKKIWMADGSGGCSPDVLVFRAKPGVNSYYLFSILQQDCFYEYVMKAPKGSKMPRGDQQHIMRFPIKELSHSEITTIEDITQKISLTLKLYTELCDNLSNMIHEMFEHWFIQFDFPNQNGEPYRQAGGSVIKDEKTGISYPDSWSLMTVNDITKRVKVGFVGQVDDYYCDSSKGFPIVRPTEMDEDGIDYEKLRHITKEFFEVNGKSQLHFGDVIISRCGKDGIPNIYESAKPAQVLNAVVIEPNYDMADSVFILELLKSDLLQKQIKNMTGGSVQGVLNTEWIANMSFPFNKGMSKKFSDLVAPLYKKYRNSKDKIRLYTELREYIVPLMLSGQVGEQ